MDALTLQSICGRWGMSVLPILADVLADNPAMSVSQLEDVVFAKTSADNDRLRERIDQLESELGIARAQIEQLQSRRAGGLAFLQEAEPLPQTQSPPLVAGSDVDIPDPASGVWFPDDE